MTSHASHLPRALALTALALALALTACDTEPSSPDGPDALGPDVAVDGVAADNASAARPDTADGMDSDAAADVGPDVTRVPAPRVGDDASGLAVAPDRDLVVWSEGGDLWAWDASSGDQWAVVAHPAVQKEPTLAGDRLVWADDRGGDFDLWALDLADPSAAPAPLVQRAGDDDQPTLDADGRWLAWVGRLEPPHEAHNKDIWLMDLTGAREDGAPFRVLADEAEQTHPHVRGDRVVWTDYGADPDGIYLPTADPNANNGDILGWDLATDTGFVVVDDPSKQVRAAIDGDTVVWMDWRGINPEPKYSEFQVFAKTLGGDEALVAWSAWERPQLWRRPAVDDGRLAFLALAGEAAAVGQPPSPVTVQLAPVDPSLGEPVVVVESQSPLDAVWLGEGKVAWLGPGELGLTDVTPPDRQD